MLSERRLSPLLTGLLYTSTQATGEREHRLYLDIVRRGNGVCGHSRIWPDIVQFQYRIQNTLHSSPQPSQTGPKITTDWYLISDMYVITTSQSTYSSTQHLSAREGRGREGGLLHVQPLSLYTIETHEAAGCTAYHRPVQNVTTSSPATTSQQCIIDIIVWQSNPSFKLETCPSNQPDKIQNI